VKTALLFLLSLATLACASGVTINRVQPLGQKSVYKMRNNMKSEAMSLSVDRGTRSSEMNMSAVLESEVTATHPDGTWTVTNKITQVEMKVDGKDEPGANALLTDKVFAVTMDRDGKVVKVTGDLLQGMAVEHMFSQLSPTTMLPDKNIKAGESWPFEITTTLQGNLKQTMKGAGRCIAVSGDEATMEFDYIIQLSKEGDQNLNFTGTGNGKTTVVYDPDKARFISNKSDVTLETAGRLNLGDKSEAVKNTLSTSLQVELVNR
jgi:hypothetical protein